MKLAQKQHCQYLKILLKMLYKEDFKDFEIPENIYLTSLNYDTGKKVMQGDKKSIIEALKI